MTDVPEGEKLALRFPPDALPTRVDSWVSGQLSGVTRASVQRWIGDGRVLVNGQVCRPKDKLRPGALVEVYPDVEPATEASPDPSVVFEVVHEDEHLLVVDKPAGLVVHPGKGNWTGTLVNGLLARPGFERPVADPNDAGGHLRPGIVHRIDKDTSGLLVVAKTVVAREHLKKQLLEHTVQRRYRALSIGAPRAGRIETLYGRDPKSRLRFSSGVPVGKHAVTHVDVAESLGGSRAALVSCRLETGRTHQIRVHLSEERGTPLLADALYGGFRGDPEVVEIARRLGRQALHAELLGFVHPVTGESLSFESAMPEDMRMALESLRKLSGPAAR